jgi:hypothetical protein
MLFLIVFTHCWAVLLHQLIKTSGEAKANNVPAERRVLAEFHVQNGGQKRGENVTRTFHPGTKKLSNLWGYFVARTGRNVTGWTHPSALVVIP